MSLVTNNSVQANTSFYDLPFETVGYIMSFCPTSSIGPLTRTCHRLFQQVFVEFAKGSLHTSPICTKLLQGTSLDAINQFLTRCKQTKAVAKAPITVCVAHRGWSDLPKALHAIQDTFPIHHLGIQGDFTSSDVSACLQFCPDVKTIRFFDCHKINFNEIPQERFQNLEKLGLSHVTFITSNDNNRGDLQSISEIANRCKVLKQISLHRCDNFYPDFDDFTCADNSFEGFRETEWDAEAYDYDWDQWIAESAVSDEVFSLEPQTTNPLYEYFLATKEFHTGDAPEYSKVYELLNQSIKKYPRFVNPKIRLARLLRRDKDNFSLEVQKKAEELLKESVEITPNNAMAHVELGLLFIDTKREKAGYEYLMKIVPLCMREQASRSLLKIANALKNAEPRISEDIRDYIFWDVLDLGRQGLYLSIKENGHLLSFVRSYMLFFTSNREHPETRKNLCTHLESMTPLFDARDDFSGFMLTAFLTKNHAWLEPIRKSLLPEILPEEEQAMQKLMENLFDVSSWIILLKGLLRSEENITPCFSLLALFMTESHISHQQFMQVAESFRSSHNEWFTKSQAATVACRLAHQN